MKSQALHFKRNAAQALDNPVLQENLRKFGSAGLAALRARAVSEFGTEPFEELREASRAIRQRSVEQMDLLIQRFEREATASGATVLFAETTEEARALILASLGGHTAAEIAEIERIPIGTAKTRLRTALLRVRRACVSEEVDHDDHV